MKRFATAAVLAALFAAAPVIEPLGASAQTGTISLDARDTDITDVIRLLGAESGTNIVPDSSIKPAKVTLRLSGVSFTEALTTLTTAYNLSVHREGRILIVGDSASMNRRFADSGANLSTQTIVIPIKHAKPDDVASQLVPALPAGTVVVPDKRSSAVVITASGAVIERAKRLVAAFDAPAFGAGGAVSTVAIPLGASKASEAVKALRGVVPDGAVFADDHQNAVVVTGNDETVSAVRSVLTSLDAPGSQVMFDVRVADVTPANDSSDIGFTFGGAGFGSGALGQFAYTLVRTTPEINIQLNALVSQGRASILAQPRIATLNNKEAYLLVGESYPVIISNLQTGLPTVQTIDVGVKLRLTPTIGPDKSIIAELHPEYSEISGLVQQYPIVTNRKLDSTLRVKDGETIVLGGLFQDIDNDTITKLPFLGDIPVLGEFFRNRQHTHRKDEVVFMITPHVIANEK